MAGSWNKGAKQKSNERLGRCPVSCNPFVSITTDNSIDAGAISIFLWTPILNGREKLSGVLQFQESFGMRSSRLTLNNDLLLLDVKEKAIRNVRSFKTRLLC